MLALKSISVAVAFAFAGPGASAPSAASHAAPAPAADQPLVPAAPPAADVSVPPAEAPAAPGEQQASAPPESVATPPAPPSSEPLQPAPVTSVAPQIVAASLSGVPNEHPLGYVAPTPPPITRTGRGMLVAASLVGGLGLVVRVRASVTIASVARDRSDDFLAGSSLAVSGETFLQSIFYNPLIATGLGLLGGGMWRRGRWMADQDLFRGAVARRAKQRVALGWSLFAAGGATWLVTRLLGAGLCTDGSCTHAVLELGYYSSLAMTTSGLAIGSWSSGYRRYSDRWSSVVSSMRIAPTAAAGQYGLALSGRF